MFFKGAPSGLRQFLATESPLKIMKNVFYFTLKAFFVPKIFKFLSWFFGHVVKLLDYKDKANFKIHDVTTWLTNNCKAHIAEEEYQNNISESKDNQAMEYGFYTICVIVWRVGDFRNILKPSCRPLTFTSYKSFLKNKKKSRTSVAALFSAWLLKKNIYVVIFY